LISAQSFDNIKTTKFSDRTCMLEGAGGTIAVSVGDDVKANTSLTQTYGAIGLGSASINSEKKSSDFL